MSFVLKKHAINILVEKYKIKKNLIKKIEKEINSWGIVKRHEDYFELVEKIISTYIYVNSQVKEFSKSKDKLIIGMTVDYIVEYELKKKYGINMEKHKKNKKEIIMDYNFSQIYASKNTQEKILKLKQ